MATRGPRSDTLQIPDSMHPDIRSLLERDAELQAELSTINEGLRKKRDERSNLLDNPESETAQQLQALEDEISAQRDLQNEIRSKLASLGSEKNRTFDKLRGVSERLAILRLELRPLRDHRRVSEDRIRKLRVEASALQRDVDRIKSKLTVVSVPELEKKLQELDVKIAHAKKDPKKLTALEVYVTDKAKLERTGDQVREYWVLAEKLVDLKNQADKLQQSILPAEKELAEKEALIKELDAQQKELEKQRKEEEKEGKKEDERVVKLRAQLKAAGDLVRAKIEEKRQLKENLTGSGGDTPLAAGISQDAKRRDELQTEISANRKKIPEALVSFDRELAPDLLGPRRCNIQSLQDDFGVMVSVQQDEGRIRIRGHKDDIGRAKEAIEQALQRAKDNRVQAVLTFNPGLARDLIGKGGQNIERIQSHSGAKINVNSKDSKIEIQGNAAAVAEAKKVIEEFLTNTTIVEAPLRREYMDIITAKAGRMIRNIQSSSGLKNLSVDRAGMKIVMVGTPEAVQAARASLDNLLDGCNPDGVEIKFDVNLIGAILGKGGVNINKIEEETCTLLEITKPPPNRVGKAATTASLRIKGSRKGVEAARHRVNELLSANAREEQVMEYDRALLSFLIARPEGNPDGLCVLEAVRRETGCASVQAVRDTNKLRIVGKTENVVAAKAKLAEILAEQSKGTVTVDYPLAAFAFLNRKPEDGGRALLDAIRQETGVRQLRSDKNSGKISIVGEPEQTAAAAAAVRKLLESVKDRVRTVPLPNDNMIGRVIGQGGSTIRLLEERTKCDITVDKANVAVQIFGDPSLLDAAEAQVKEKAF